MLNRKTPDNIDRYFHRMNVERHFVLTLLVSDKIRYIYHSDLMTDFVWVPLER